MTYKSVCRKAYRNVGATFSRESDPAHKIHFDGKCMRMQYMHFGHWHLGAGQFVPTKAELEATDWRVVK